MENPDPKTTLSEYIRTVAGLKGTKVSCEQGGCGACTVVLAPMDEEATGMEGKGERESEEKRGGGGEREGESVFLSHRVINSCLRPLCAMDGMAVTTVEGVGSRERGLHEIQKKLVEHNGSQCGFCTPGFVMSMYGLLKDKPNPTAQQIEDQFDGNLCRCTGYRPILDAFQTFACSDTCQKTTKNCSTEIEDLCNKTKTCIKTKQSLSSPSSSSSSLVSSDSPVLSSPSSPPLPLLSTKNGVSWIRLHSLETLVSLLLQYPEGGVRLVVGNTGSGVYEPENAEIIADISLIPELRKIKVEEDGVLIGGAVPITDFMQVLEENKEKSPSFEPLVKHMYRVANHMVRNIGSVSGNLMLTLSHPDFVSDLSTLLMGAGTKLLILRVFEEEEEKKESFVSLEEFFALKKVSGLVVKAIKVPFLGFSEKFSTQKVALRRVNSHAFVNGSFRFRVDTETGTIIGLPTIVFGGVKDFPQRAFLTEKFLAARSFMDESVIQKALSILLEELKPDPKFGRTEYRSSVIPAFLYKALLKLWPLEKLPSRLRSTVEDYNRPISKGEISFDEGDPSLYPVTKPKHKLSEEIQTTGEAIYVDDIDYVNQLHSVIVFTKYGNALIDSINPSKALKSPGVKAFLSAESLRKDGFCNVISEQEELFISKKAIYCGQALGLIVAETKDEAEAAAKLVDVTYSNIQKPILTFEDAVKFDSFFPETRAVLRQGDPENALAEAEVIIEGSTKVGHQYHFHLETQRAVCVPGEDQSIQVFSSTQNPSQVQAVVATALNRPQNKVKVIIKRIGGAYGAKINRATPIAVACALASEKVKKPVRLVLDLSTNMQNVGARSPYHCTYKVSATKEGRITALKMTILNDQGAHYDLDPPTTELFLAFLDNVYGCPNWDVDIVCVRTNLPACTYMRGPAFVEAVFMIETILEHVASSLGAPPEKVRLLNMYRKGDVTPTGQHLTYCNARYIFSELQKSSDYSERVKSVASFNEGSLWVKRGISLVPIRFGIFWQDNVFRTLVNIFPDGSVSILQSGVEVGQGLNVKVAQVAAMELGKALGGGGGGLSLSYIKVGDVTTDVSNNVACTGGSITSELSAKATQDACKVLVSHLSIVSRQLAIRNKTNPSWEELIEASVEAGIDLQATGVVCPGPSPYGIFQYMSYGAAVTEAEVDILTGDTRILRSDLLLDCGKSLNPAVDIGQTQGAYIMGLGYFLTEDFIYDEESLTGKLLSDGTWEYKPPSHKDIPHDFRTALLKNSTNPSGFLRSKASGEPPYAMAASALLSVRQAIGSSRLERGDSSWVPLSSPATIDKVALAANVSTQWLRF